MACQRAYCTSDPEGDRVIKRYLETGLYPVNAPPYLTFPWNGKLPPKLWQELVQRSDASSLRNLSRDYAVSYETIRRTLAVARANSVT
jgi:hypothetical protein